MIAINSLAVVPLASYRAWRRSRQAFSIGLFFLLANGTAAACDNDLAIALLHRCYNAIDAVDDSKQQVFCAEAAQELGLCADEESGSLRQATLRLKAESLFNAGHAWYAQNNYKAGLLLKNARDLYTAVLKSPDADAQTKALAQDALRMMKAKGWFKIIDRYGG